MSKTSKVIKINEDLYKRLCELDGIQKTMLKLLIVYTPSKMRFIQRNGEFFLKIGYERIPYNVTTVIKPIRVPFNVFSALMSCKLAPNEDLNSVLFRLISYYDNRPKLPILLFFHGSGCPACEIDNDIIKKFSAKKTNQKLLDVISVDDDGEKECGGLIAHAFGVRTIPNIEFLDPDCNAIKGVDTRFGTLEDLQKLAIQLHTKYCRIS
jgi:thiol-disulfide isomerase/thioredoxin